MGDSVPLAGVLAGDGAQGKEEVPSHEGSATPEGLKAMARARAYQRELYEEACKQNVRLESKIAQTA